MAIQIGTTSTVAFSSFTSDLAAAVSTATLRPQIPKFIEVLERDPLHWVEADYRGFDTFFSDIVYDLGDPDGYFFRIYLYNDGCQGKSGQQNCTAACADPVSVWGDGNSSTLANCMVYPWISSALGRNVTLYWIPDSGSRVSFPNDGAVYGILPDSSLDLNTPEPWAVINECTTAHCKAIDQLEGNCDLTEQMIYKSGWSIGEFSPVLYINTTLCHIDDSLNPDLGGVGMVIAYLIQFSILLAAWILNVVSELGTVAFVRATTILSDHGHGQSRWQRKAKKFHYKMQHSRHAAVLNATLVEFQKTQVFFMLAVAIAALLADSKTSPFIFVISLCSVIVSSALWLYTTRLAPSKPLQTQIDAADTLKLVACGGSYATRTCQGSDSFLYSGAFTFDLRVWLFPPLIMIFLAAEEVKLFESTAERVDGKKTKTNVFTHLKNLLIIHKSPKSPRLRKGQPHVDAASQASIGTLPHDRKASLSWMQNVHQRLSHHLSRTMRFLAGARDTILTPHHITTTFSVRRSFARISLHILRLCYKYLPLVAEIGLVGMSAMLLAQYARYQHHMVYASWSLGQIISVTIWVPVGVEYAHLLVWGMEEGFEYRLKRPYHVKKDEDEEDTASAWISEDEEPAMIGAAQHANDTQPSLRYGGDEIEMSTRSGSELASLTSRHSWEPQTSPA
ncbi:hypothetical protein LTS10_006089 [Elasticomyces elasticus]|nr:hypothetical protein LTS10_006089 [Elasticomyces elasticus]